MHSFFALVANFFSEFSRLKLFSLVFISSLIAVLLSLKLGGFAATAIVLVPTILSILQITKGVWTPEGGGKSTIGLASLGAALLIILTNSTWRPVINSLLEPLLSKYPSLKDRLPTDSPSILGLLFLAAVIFIVDLAELYDEPTYRLNEAVKRNRRRFPSDFMFQLNKKEAESLRSQSAISNTSQGGLRSQFATSKTSRGGRRYLPYAFTEQGVAMLSSVLNGERAIEVNIAIMRAFVKLRQMLESNEELNRKFTAVIRKLATHDKYFTVVFDELKKLNEPPTRPRKQIGFKTAADT